MKDKIATKTAHLAKRGKEWEGEMAKSLGLFLRWQWSFDNIGRPEMPEQLEGLTLYGAPKQRHRQRTPPRPADLLGTYRGQILLLEAKETRQSSLSRSCLTPDEEEALYHINADGGLAVVAIRRPNANGTWSAWLCYYADLVGMMRALGRKSLPLDGLPACFVPMAHIVPKGKRSPRWDVQGALDQLCARGIPGAYHKDPEQELGQRAAAKARKGKL